MTLFLTGEKRPLEDSFSSIEEPCKKRKIEGDVPKEVLSEVVAEITDPSQMIGPEVSDKP